MTSRTLRTRARLGLLGVLVLTMVAACGLPRSGPNKREIFSSSVQRQGDAFVVSVTDRVARATAVTPALGFPDSLLRAGQVGSDTIRPGDTLGLTIWENVEDGLLVGTGQNAAVLEEVQVDGAGFIFIPYAGRIRAAGNTPEALRGVITRQLDTQTPDPQVQVRRLAGDGSTVTIVGGVAQQGVYPIERPTRTLTAMLARAGGVVSEPQITTVTLNRGGQSGKIWLSDLYEHPEMDIALRPGDRIVLAEDTRAFVALGATGTQNRVPFTAQTLSAIEAIAQVGGLNTNLADPTGVFVFRNEPEEIARQILGRTDITGTQRFVYVLDLTRPMGMFNARDFVIRDQDTVYVTEAPFAVWDKTLTSLTGSLSTANAASSLAN